MWEHLLLGGDLHVPTSESQHLLHPPHSMNPFNDFPIGSIDMPYLLGWLLGVPVIVLVILYLIFH
jgi:hypothetical protein